MTRLGSKPDGPDPLYERIPRLDATALRGRWRRTVVVLDSAAAVAVEARLPRLLVARNPRWPGITTLMPFEEENESPDNIRPLFVWRLRLVPRVGRRGITRDGKRAPLRKNAGC